MSKQLVSRDAFLGSFKREYDYVDTSLGTFRIRNLNEPEKAEHECYSMGTDGGFEKKKHKTHRRRLLLLCLVDEDGKPFLKSEDLGAMSGADPAVISQLYLACHKHCGFAKEEEETGKNFGETDDAGSATG